MEVRVRLPQIDEQMKDMYFYTSDWRAQSLFHKSVKRMRGEQDSMEHACGIWCLQPRDQA